MLQSLYHSSALVQRAQRVRGEEVASNANDEVLSSDTRAAVLRFTIVGPLHHFNISAARSPEPMLPEFVQELSQARSQQN